MRTLILTGVALALLTRTAMAKDAPKPTWFSSNERTGVCAAQSPLETMNAWRGRYPDIMAEVQRDDSGAPISAKLVMGSGKLVIPFFRTIKACEADVAEARAKGIIPDPDALK